MVLGARLINDDLNDDEDNYWHSSSSSSGSGGGGSNQSKKKKHSGEGNGDEENVPQQKPQYTHGMEYFDTGYTFIEDFVYALNDTVMQKILE